MANVPLSQKVRAAHSKAFSPWPLAIVRQTLSESTLAARQAATVSKRLTFAPQWPNSEPIPYHTQPTLPGPRWPRCASFNTSAAAAAGDCIALHWPHSSEHLVKVESQSSRKLNSYCISLWSNWFAQHLIRISFVDAIEIRSAQFFVFLVCFSPPPSLSSSSFYYYYILSQVCVLAAFI